MLRCDNPSLITFFFILRLTLLLPQAYLGTMHQTSILFHFLVSVFLFVFVLCLCWSFVFVPMFVMLLAIQLYHSTIYMFTSIDIGALESLVGTLQQLPCTATINF